MLNLPKYFIPILVFIILSTNKVNASAWLLEEGRYRYSINISNVDKASKKEKKQREIFAREIKEEIEQLEAYAGQLKTNSPDYKKILKRIKKLQQAARQLPLYQEEWFTSGAIEYGITDNQNFGVHFLFKKEKFNDKKTFNEEASLFYKLKLFQENDFVRTYAKPTLGALSSCIK